MIRTRAGTMSHILRVEDDSLPGKHGQNISRARATSIQPLRPPSSQGSDRMRSQPRQMIGRPAPSHPPRPTRGQSLLYSTSQQQQNPNELQFDNSQFVKELEELRALLRDSQVKTPSTNSENAPVSSNDASPSMDQQRKIQQLEDELNEAKQVQEKLSVELRIERNRRLELQRVNEEQAKRIEQLVAQLENKS